LIFPFRSSFAFSSWRVDTVKQLFVIAALVLIEGGVWMPLMAQTSESGLAPTLSRGSAASYYYIGKPGELTMTVNLWGAVKTPGRYEVPSSTDLVQLLSYAGGPLEIASRDDIKVTRLVKKDGGITRGEYFVDLEDLSNVDPGKLTLYPGDTIFIDYSSWSAWRDAFIVVGVLATVTIATTSVIRAVHDY
jgi:hypothetical protein